MKPRILILRAPGTNCDAETAFAFERAGGSTQNMHVRQLLDSPQLLSDFQVLCIAGGFSYGDDMQPGEFSASNCNITWPMRCGSSKRLAN